MPRHLRIGAALALAGSLALALAGCAKKKSVVDPSFTIPEGVFSSELELITYLDQPNSKIRMFDRGSIGKPDLVVVPDTTLFDAIDQITPVRANPAGSVRGLVLNRSAAEGVEIFRSEPNGSVRKIFEFALQPSRRWIDRRSEVYEFVDSDPKRPAGASYYARGLVGGVAGKNSPLSSASRPTLTSLTEIRYAAERWGTALGGSFTAAESTFYMAWSPVSGAQRYVIHVFEYQPRSFTLSQRILSGAPSPVLTTSARDIFLASLPASAGTAYRLGDPGATIYTYRTPRMRTDYYVRISAIDANGQMIGTTTGPNVVTNNDLNRIYVFGLDKTARDHFMDLSSPEVASASPPAYLLFSRGAVWVSPGINPNPTTALSRSRDEALGP